MIASYLISTSNHNWKLSLIDELALLLISFLHQTTTKTMRCSVTTGLLLFSFLHQTTTLYVLFKFRIHCFLSHFYIKPQRAWRSCSFCCIASYLISTSNHNNKFSVNMVRSIASYLISTSNHNTALFDVMQGLIASYLISTSNHN